MVRIKGTLPTTTNRATVRGHHASHTRNALVAVLASGQGHTTIIKISTSISTARDRVTFRDEDSDMEPISTSHTPIRTTAPPARVPLPASAKTAMYRVAPNTLMDSEELTLQSAYLDGLSETLVASAEIERDDIMEKESFRIRIQEICRQVIVQHEEQTNGRTGFPASSIGLECFGSLSSGFATKASDMDLGLISPLSVPQPDGADTVIPRLIEKAFLDAGLGARLLTRTRVPIIKLCSKPSESLLSGLLEERDKWEKGIDNDPLGAAEGEDGDEAVQDQDEEQQLKSPTVAAQSQLPASTGDPNPAPKPSVDQPQNLKLRQTEKQNLTSYYNNAKRALRRLNGRDITLSNYTTFSGEDFEILTRICEAFVEGLYDQILKARLQGYQSLIFRPHNDNECSHSLLGVFTQVEGEMLAMGWEHRTTQEKSADAEKAAEVLKKLNSIQLVTLQQTQFESASEYYERVAKLIVNLRPAAFLAEKGEDLFQELVIKHYVEGIWSFEVQKQVGDFVAATSGPISLGTVARRHKSLQLAFEFERALEHHAYDSHLEPVIKQYVALLRGDTNQPGDMSTLALAAPESQQVLQVILSLSDPSKLTANQPRDRYRDNLEFPKSGVGVQCDINFAAHLALQNTLLLRCYSHTDPRVRTLVLFVKHWAKSRAINTPYRGTLSSYGYVLMMLHYLVNVVEPFVCPNLQHLGPPPPPQDPSTYPDADGLICRGRFVGFWRDEAEIQRLARARQLNGNDHSVGRLLRGFFEYYAHTGTLSANPKARGFDWGRDVLSLRTPRGLLSKQTKGWTGAKTVLENVPSPAGAPAAANANAAEAKPVEVKEVRHRYLFAIEDPFELDHNVARTVTHNGIVAIRDEFRRAWRLIRAAGKGNVSGGGGGAAAAAGEAESEELLQDVKTVRKESDAGEFRRLLAEIHDVERAELEALAAAISS
ncbi:Terminal uridylyltransferase cid1 like protein [Verticillium longisporum]|nr:Terminal uridylyltransferase cid1 like protein [Verticillium longisporum]